MAYTPFSEFAEMDFAGDDVLTTTITLYEYRKVLTENTQFKMFLSIADMLGIDLTPIFDLMKTGVSELIGNAANAAIEEEGNDNA
ncbi:MAG: hypothetical protein DBY20_03700 [Coriobacteriia bacterium]|nr:MAG: hypothetical protein DBY20_03700 [Coriobacteriia bacterium]